MPVAAVKATERHHQQHRQRDRPAFIERGQQQEDDDQRQAEQQPDLATGLLFLEGGAGPLEAHARGQDFACDLLHRVERGPGRLAGRSHAGDGQRRIAVIPLQLLRTILPTHLREGREGHHIALLIADTQRQHVVGRHALRRIGLQIDAQHIAFANEVIGIGRTESDRQCLVDVGDLETECPCLDAVYIHIELRRRPQTFRTNPH